MLPHTAILWFVGNFQVSTSLCTEEKNQVYISRIHYNAYFVFVSASHCLWWKGKVFLHRISPRCMVFRKWYYRNHWNFFSWAYNHTYTIVSYVSTACTLRIFKIYGKVHVNVKFYITPFLCRYSIRITNKNGKTYRILKSFLISVACANKQGVIVYKFSDSKRTSYL